MTPLHTSDGGRPPQMRTDWMALHGSALVEMGYPIIPIIPGAKCPGRWRASAGWEAYPDWDRHCDRLTKPFELSIWEKWPGCGIGLASGRIGGFDIDILDADLSDQIDAMARTELGDTPAIRIGRAPKKLLVYRMDQPFAKIAMHPLEFIGRGAQFVAYGIHPDTQEPYRWPYEDLAEVLPGRLPVVSEAQVRSFMERALKLVPPDMRQNRMSPDRSTERYLVRGGDLRGTLGATTEAVAFIPNADWHYDDWIKIGQAIKGSVGEDGWPLFADWSAKSTKNDPKVTEKAWRSFKPHSLGFGTLWHYATEYGWAPSNEVIFNAVKAEAKGAGHELFAALTASPPALPPHDPETGEIIESPASAPADASEIAALVAEAPGAIGRMTRWIVETAVSPQPLLSLGASLCALGVAMGHRYRLDRPDTRSNIYIIALADSGAGKDHPRRCVRRAMVEAGLSGRLGGETLASGAALMTSVAHSPCRLFQVDEFGHFVKAVLDPRSHAHHRREIMTNLTTLWSSASEVVIGTEYANSKERPRQDIREPCVCVYGSTVPLVFWQALQSGSVGDGSLARFLVIQTPQNYPDDQVPKAIEDDLHLIVADLKAIAAGAATGGNLSAHVVHTVPISAEAEALDAELRAEHLTLKRQHENTPFSSIVARFREHIRRIALIATVAEDPAQPVVSASNITWAARFVRWSQGLLMSEAERFIADSEHEASLKKVLDIIRRHGGWMDGHELAKRTQFLNRRDRNEQISQLEESGLIEMSREAGVTKPKTLVRAVKKS